MRRWEVSMSMSSQESLFWPGTYPIMKTLCIRGGGRSWVWRAWSWTWLMGKFISPKFSKFGCSKCLVTHATTTLLLISAWENTPAALIFIENSLLDGRSWPLLYEIYSSTSLKEVKSGKDPKGWEKVPWKLIESDVKMKAHESESERGCDFTDVYCLICPQDI